MTLALIAIIAFIVTVFAVPFAIVSARHLSIVDLPGELKPQDHPVPYLGGVAVLIGVSVGVIPAKPTVLIALSLATLIGVLDDRFDPPPVVRLIGQALVGLLVFVTSDVRIGGVAGLVLAIFVTMLLINGVNLLDGLDMLASGVVAAGCLGFLFLSVGADQYIPIAAIAALLGFLVFNRPPARIYLGDGGSYLLGTLLAVLLAAAWAPGVATARAVATLLLVSIAVAEVFFGVVRRLRDHLSIFAGDRGHPYDRMVEMGWNRAAVSGVYIGFALALSVAAILAGRSNSLPVAVLVDCLGALALFVGGLITGGMSQKPVTT